MPVLSTPKFRVVLADPAGEDGMTEHVVQSLNVDWLGWDRDRARYGWPEATVAPIVWSTYLAWHAMVRLAIVPAMKLAEFEALALQVEAVADAAAEDGGPGDPTRSVAGPE